MAYEVRKIESFTADMLFRLLERKHLLTLPVRNNPTLLVAPVMEADFYGFFDGDRVGAYLMEARSIDPGTLDLTLIPEDKTLCLHAHELLEISAGLRDRWFGQEGWSKVQASVAKSRKNACRTLSALGFVCETRGCGIRNGITLGKDPEPLHVYGLLPDDPYPVVMQETEHAEA